MRYNPHTRYKKPPSTLTSKYISLHEPNTRKVTIVSQHNHFSIQHLKLFENSTSFLWYPHNHIFKTLN